MTTQHKPRLIGIMPTCGRQELLAQTLDSIAAQTRPPDLVVIVDNEASPDTRTVIDVFLQKEQCFDVKLVDSLENLGSAGGWALAIESALPEVHDDDWFVTLDDDDPPLFQDELERVFNFAIEQKGRDEKTAAVGIVGARFNWETGFLVRLEDHELDGVIEVDYVGNNNLAMYSVGVVRRHGGFRGELFFGHTEVDFCLRLRDLGYGVFANGTLWKRRREFANRMKLDVKPDRMCTDRWKKYYVIRNYIYIMLHFKRLDLALKQAFIQVVVKPLYTLPRDPGLAFRGFLLAVRASFDGLTKRMGRTLTPRNFDAKVRNF